MKVSVIGTGYVGLVSGTCFAEIGHQVTCIDCDEKKIKMLWEGKSPIYEPGLNELLERNIKSKQLTFSTGYESIKDSKVTFLAVGTPSDAEGNADLSYLYAAARDAARYISEGAILVVKSTVPVGTGFKIEEEVRKITNKKFYIVNNPEFLKEGSAIDDFMRPDRVVVGHRTEEEGKAMDELYAPLVRQGHPIHHMSNLSAEITKYAANCFLATKISFINEIARFCDVVGADIDEVRRGITSDRRIGNFFLYPGPGYGGSCFPKDVRALIGTCAQHDVPLKIVRATNEVNIAQKTYMFGKMEKHYGDLKGKTIAMWGVAFKPNTDDIRESPAIDMSKALIKAGAKVRYFDPVANDNFEEYMADHAASLQRFENKYDCLNGADGLLVITDWSEFKAPDLSEIKSRLKEAALFDTRNLYPLAQVKELGFKYYAIGRRV
jgi:UDPglucose 6-dehydrogenase